MRRLQPAPVLATGLAALLLLCSCASSDQTKVDPEKKLELYREMALQFFDQGELLRAEDQVRKGLDIDPDDEQLKLIFGWVRQKRGTTEDVLVAEKVFRDLEGSEDYRVSLGLAQALERKGVLYWQGADQIEAGERDAEDPEVRARELREEARDFWLESADRYEQTLARRPSEPQALNGLQRVWALIGDDEKSLEWSDRLLEQLAGEMVFWNEQLQRADLTAAEEERLRELLQATSELRVQTHLQASTLLVRLERPEAALAHLDQILELQPERSDAFSRRAQILRDLERYEEAIANLDEFLRLSPLEFDHPDVRRAFDIRSECERALRNAAAPAAR